MGKRLYIAEKPSLAREIAKSIGVKTKSKHSIVCNNGDEVTWLLGHLVGLKDPHEYEAKFKRWDRKYLPIIPDAFEKKPTGDASAKKQLAEVLKKIKTKTFTELVNAGDPDREGQLLVDEVIDYAGGAKDRKVLRFWSSSLSEEKVAKTIANLEDNTDPKFVNLSIAGEARSRADWMIGLNLTRAATLRARDFGITEVISVGRVQSPTLSIIVMRDNEIDNFVPIDFLTPVLICSGGALEATWQAKDTDTPSFDVEGRLIDSVFGKKLVDVSTATVVSSSKTKKKISAPLPYSLSTLQKIAANKFSFTAKKTLDVCQKLYEAKYTTYPRSDCQYLPEDLKPDAKDTLDALSGRFPAVKDANTSLSHKAWNTKKVDAAAHHAIMPEKKVPKSLGPDEEKIYKLICESYIQLFLPEQEIETHAIVLSSDNEGGQKWKATATKTTLEGWKQVAGSGESTKVLPVLSKGDVIDVDKGELKAKKTKPPSRFNDGTAIEAMKTIHKYVTDPHVRSQLRENEGIGTEATRANTLETLIKRGYIERKGKFIISTPLGKEVDEVLPAAVKDPGMTALWETYLSAIEKGEAPVEGFYDQIKAAVEGMTVFTLKADFVGREIHECPTCNGVIIRLESKKKKGVFYWYCTQDNDCPLVGDNKGELGEPFSKKS